MSTAITTTPPMSITPQVDPYAPVDLTSAEKLAEHIASSRLFGITEPSKALVILATGYELGLSPMQSLRAIHVIEGKPSISADGLAAIVKRSPVCEYFREIETTDQQSTWETKRVGEPVARYTFTLAEARKAGLCKPNGNWDKYPTRMLRARAKAFLARDIYPDVLIGLYSTEEMQDVARPRVHVEVVEQVVDALPDIAARIAVATQEELADLREEARTKYPERRAELVAAYQARKAELSNVA